MNPSLDRSTRKLHRWGAVLTLLPLLIVIVSGLLLQVKKEVAWIQPPTQTGSEGHPQVDWETILATATRNESAEVTSWDDIDRMDVRPGRGLVKVQCKNKMELQIDLVTGEELSSAFRRSDLIESLHDGSFFHDSVKLWIFLPSGLILLGLWFTGVYLWWLPIRSRRKKKRRMAERANP